MELLERLLERLREVWAGMTLNQKVVTGGSLAAILFASFYISTLGDRMVRYTVLFGNLDAQSANEIVNTLDADGVPYRLGPGGTSIEVPEDQADRLKIQFTAEGLPQSGVVGYEILDQTNFGMTDFLQNVNYKRALEGEMSRNIRQMDGVDDAKVMLVIPEKTIFDEQAEPPTASVRLKLRPGRTLSAAQISTVQNLVASGTVGGLNPADVTVVDSNFNQLSKPHGDDIAMQAGSLLQQKLEYERLIANKVRQQLEPLGRLNVTVTADIDFDSLERMSTRYWPADSSAVLSEETIETESTDGSSETNTVTNYNTSSVVEKLVNNPGTTVKRLSVGVLIDARDSVYVNGDGVQEVAKVSRTEGELAGIRSMVEGAIGFDPDRGDRVELLAMDFPTAEYAMETGGTAVNATIVEVVRALTLGIAILAAIAVFFVVVRSITRSLDPSRMTVSGEKEIKRHVTIEEAEETENERTQLIRRIMSKAIQDPEMTAKTIKAIYRDEG